MIKYYARKDKSGKYQTIKDHLLGVANLASSYSSIPNTTMLAGLLHDIGKFCQKFQHYLTKGGKRGEVVHSQQGIYFLSDLSNGDFASDLLIEIISFIIASHHGELPDAVSLQGDRVFLERFDKDKAATLCVDEVKKTSKDYLQDVDADFEKLFSAASKEILNFLIGIKQRYKSIKSTLFALGLLVKYTYSCLVDADRLDAYLFGVKEEYRPIQPNWEKLIDALEQNLSKFSCDDEISKVRFKISGMCKAASNKKTGIYNLSVPTGGGKTLSSLRFALYHAHDKKRIIYVIPYLSIIEQTAKTIRQFLNLDKDSTIILEHHSDVVQPTDEEEAGFAKLASARWDNPIIITTLVQFLDTVMSSKASKLRKFHNMQDSVIIFDEVQSLPIHSIHLFNEVVSFLSTVLNSTIVLCTATQPLLDKTERKNLLIGDKPNLISDVSADFATIKRTNIVIKKEQNLDEFARFIVDRLNNSKNCLVIVNTKRAAKDLYKKIANTNPSFMLYHLSTSMCPQHRMDTLVEIKSLLESKRKFLCISTQLIEAGVDVSFDCVVRSMAGLDSILQAAGRCNRNGEHSQPQNVYVVPYAEENLDRLVDIKKGKEFTQRVIRENPNADYLDAKILEKYYDYYFFSRKDYMDYPTKEGDSVYTMLSDNNDGTENYKNRTGKEYQHQIRQAFKTASDSYQTIESNSESLVVYYKDAKNLLARYKQADNLKKSNCLKEKLKIIKKLEKYCISIYRGPQLDELIRCGGITVLDDEFGIKVLGEKYYTDNTGFVSEINLVF